MMPRVRMLVAACVLGVIVVGCATQDARVTVVEELLRLRQARSADASAYAQYVDSEALAEALADADRASKGDQESPIPAWKPPFVSGESTTSAEVVVVWSGRDGYADWPYATIFEVRLRDGEWRVSDAREIEDATSMPKSP